MWKFVWLENNHSLGYNAKVGVVVKSFCIYRRNTTCEGTCDPWFLLICGSSAVDDVCFCVFMWGNVCFPCVFCIHHHGRLCGRWIVIVVVWLLVVVPTCGNKVYLSPSTLSVLLSFSSHPSPSHLPPCCLLLLHLLQGGVKSVFCQTASKDLERHIWVVCYFTLLGV